MRVVPEGSSRDIALGAEVGAPAEQSGPKKILQIPDPHCLEELAVRPQDVVAACTQKYVLTDLEPRIQVAE